MTVQPFCFDHSTLVEGNDGFLFLIGGAHSPYKYASGELIPTEHSIDSFWSNIEHRNSIAKQLCSQYRHIIVPDKHNSCKEVFPLPIKHRLADIYLEKRIGLRHLVKYPLSNLVQDFRNNSYRVDTHYNPIGSCKILLDALSGIVHDQVLSDLQTYIEEKLLVTVSDWSGDLGSKVDPVRTEDRLAVKLPGSVKRYSNKLSAGNNGIIDIYCNSNPLSCGLNKAVLLGDSYGRDIAELLSIVYKHVAFLRTPFMHDELVRMARPDLILTQNSERYLSWVQSDFESPLFFLYPFLGDKSSTLIVESQVANEINKFFTGVWSRT
ncbi:MAG: hypothetical protein QUV06_01330 [Cyanobium sp. CZS 48M]|nr:hypothetical protein [Cyanobium sp. CZS48M]